MDGDGLQTAGRYKRPFYISGRRAPYQCGSSTSSLFTNSGTPIREGFLEGVGALIFLKINSVNEVITPLVVKDATHYAALTYQENRETTYGSHTRFDLIPWCRKLHAFDFPFFGSAWAPYLFRSSVGESQK
jgi:hypothetical protein